LSQKTARWVGDQGEVKVVKKAKTCPQYDVNLRKPQNQNETKFCSIWTRRLVESVEGLNSSLAQSSGELWCCKLCKKVVSAEHKGFQNIFAETDESARNSFQTC